MHHDIFTVISGDHDDSPFWLRFSAEPASYTAFRLTRLEALYLVTTIKRQLEDEGFWFDD